MTIISVQVKGLFGCFNHYIKLKTKDRITIIHGPNGVGKTTILRLLKDIFALRIYAIRRVPFDKIIIRFSPKGTLTITRKESLEEAGEVPDVSLVYSSGTKKIEYSFEQFQDTRRPLRLQLSIIEHIIDSLERTGANEWLDTSTGDLLTVEDVIFKYGDVLPEEFRVLIGSLPEELQNLLNETNVYLIETQRLFTKSTQEERYDSHRRRRGFQERMTVEEYSEDLLSKVLHLQRESGAVSVSLDRDFPLRLLQTALPKGATEERIRELYVEQTKYRERLMQAGLMEPEEQFPLPNGTLDEMERKVLWFYLNDVQKKLKIFDALLQRAELLKEIINSRFSFKKFELDSEKGFVFLSNQDDTCVPLRSLSSGEQHELVLAYDLLFKVKQKALVLIDEPELSLHVTWQRKLLEDIARIAKLADLDFIIATHSPSIIHNRRDLMVGLGEEV